MAPPSSLVQFCEEFNVLLQPLQKRLMQIKRQGKEDEERVVAKSRPTRHFDRYDSQPVL